MLSFPQLLELRITARQVALNFHAFRLARRTLCSDAGVKLPGADSAQEVADKHGHHSNIPIHDVAIVGGGMVGMALACSLARMPLTNQLNVAIIDSNPALLNGDCIQKEDPPDPRVSTVTPATIDLFKDVGAWRYVEQHRHAYFDKMQVWDYTGFGYTRYNARDINKEILGCVVENKVLHRSLLSCLQIWEDILGFENAEFYIKRWPDLDGLRFEDVLVSFPDAIPCGVKVFADGGKIKINPDDNYILREGDEILVIAEDDDTYAPGPLPKIRKGLCPKIIDPPKFPEKILFCGWRRDIDDMIMVLEAFLAPGSELWMFNEVPEKDREKKLTDGGLDISGLVNLKLVHREGNAVIRRHLESLPLETFDSMNLWKTLLFTLIHDLSPLSSLLEIYSQSDFLTKTLSPFL